MDAFTRWLDELNHNPLAGAIVGILALMLRLELDRRARRRSMKKKEGKKEPPAAPMGMW